MSLSKAVQKVNKYDKYTVNAYINEIQRSSILKHSIPLVINELCLSFYHQTDAFEDRKRIHTYNGKTYWYPYFGTMDIMADIHSSKFLYQWKFKWENSLTPILGDSIIKIGITSAPNIMCLNHCIALSRYGYLYKAHDMSMWKMGEYDIQNLRNWNGRDYEGNLDRMILPGDEIIMSLDIKENMMEYVVRRGKHHYCITNILIRFLYKDLRHRMFVYYEGEVMDIQLIGFNKVPRLSTKNEQESILDQIKRIERIIYK